MKNRISNILVVLIVPIVLFGAGGTKLQSPVVSHVSASKSGTPLEINYQGWLGNKTDTTGVTGKVNMVFGLYDASTGGDKLWEESQDSVQVDKGIFNVLLGSIYPLPAGIFTGAALYLETQVESEILSPRKKLVSVAYAIRAEKSDSARNAIYADTANYAVITSVHYVDSVRIADTASFSYNSGSLGGLKASQFLKSDVNDTGTADYLFTGKLGIGSINTYGDMLWVDSDKDYSGYTSAIETYSKNKSASAPWTLGIKSVVDSAGAGNHTAGYFEAYHGYGAGEVHGVYGTVTQYGNGNVEISHLCGDNYGSGNFTGLALFPRNHQGNGNVYGIWTPSGIIDSGSGDVYGVSVGVNHGGVNATGIHCGVQGGAKHNTSTDGKCYGGQFYSANYGSGNSIGVMSYAINGTGEHIGVYGYTSTDTGAGDDCIGVKGYAEKPAADNNDLYGGQFSTYSNGTAGVHYGVYGEGAGGATAIGVYGYAHDGASTNYAGCFSGDVNITGTLSKGSGSFLIDHPLDPTNKLLRYNFVESPENLCLYRGKVRLNTNGEAVVEMPDCFVALTKENEATVNLTPVGKKWFGVSYEWNQYYTGFFIYGEPDREVSYVVYANRDDPVIRKLARPVEEEKGKGKICAKGEMLYPEPYGYPKEIGRDYRLQMEQGKQQQELKNLKPASN